MDLEGILRLALTVLGAYLVLLWVAFIVWAYRDARSRTKDALFHLLAVALVVILNLPGLVLYLLLRPHETLADSYNRAMEEEAMLRELETQTACPQCKRAVQADFVVCPYCRSVLKQVCPNCQRVLNLRWTVCPYCGLPSHA